MRKKFYFLAAALISLLILLLVFVLPSLWRKSPEIGENLVKNSSFEKEKKGKPTAWEAESWARGSNGKWKPVELYARTGEDVISFNLMLNLGGYASLNTGKAFFDEIVVEEVENVPRGAHVVSINWEEKGRSSFQSTFCCVLKGIHQ